MENRNKYNVNELINIRLDLYKLQGLDLTSSYARITGELQALIDTCARTNEELAHWVDFSAKSAKKDLLTSKLAA